MGRGAGDGYAHGWGARPAVRRGAGTMREPGCCWSPSWLHAGWGHVPSLVTLVRVPLAQARAERGGGWMKVSPSSPKASASTAWSLLGGHPWCPPARASSSLRPARGRLQHPQGGGDVVTHPSGAWPPAGTLSQGCVPMPCPSLPASPTLSPALSTWHTWARGGWRRSPPLWGAKGRQRVGRQVPCPSLPPSRGRWPGAVPPTGVASQPGASWQHGRQGCLHCRCLLSAGCLHSRPPG